MLCQVAVKHDVVQNIAKLFKNLVTIAGFDGMNKFVDLFNEVLDQLLMSLLGVPWAAARAAKFCGHCNQFIKLGHFYYFPCLKKP